ncbi:Aste57867_16166 [Aphanomyces stellatus]|uniref:Aste57867_16166 protein n=1 Tax=Aphanomyces stellatus TaxID=120398 RepID=A0A485L528_9STRA|nr:hypothetical protein As57867_016110 [Aphanomyces stellatus]VFT92944.1 Aste57867_16166 [Aphanomyces stellatus]
MPNVIVLPTLVKHYFITPLHVSWWKKAVVVVSVLAIVVATILWILSAVKVVQFASQNDKVNWEEYANQLSTVACVALELLHHPSTIRSLWNLLRYSRERDSKLVMAIHADFPAFPLHTARNRRYFCRILMLYNVNSIGQYAAAMCMWIYSYNNRPDMTLVWILATVPGIVGMLWQYWVERKHRQEAALRRVAKVSCLSCPL